MKSICVIGAGASGLTCIKECLDCNLNVICYEQSNYIGGLWRYHEEDNADVASVTRATIINSSKELSAFSDYPPDATLPNYCHHSNLLKYFTSYADTFKLQPHIKFRHKVVSVTQTSDAKWRVKCFNIDDAVETDVVFDGVMIATGHHTKPHRPNFSGLTDFRGTVLHTHSYKKPEPFIGSKVLIVGMGNSAGDAAVELSAVCEKVTVSTRSGSWVLSRVYKRGLPMDYLIMRRIIMYLAFHLLPYNFICWLFEWDLNQKFDHQLYGLRPKHRVLGQHPFVNDALANRILSGTIEIKGDVERFTEKGVIFTSDPDEEVQVDTVILATGYETHFEFLSDDVFNSRNSRHIDLYKYAVNANVTNPASLMFIGLIQPFGPLIPISEIQARWFCQLQIGNAQLPPRETMLRDIERKRLAHEKRYYTSPRHNMQVDYVDFLDEIAEQFNVRPRLSRYFFTDPLLWCHLLFGPSVPYQYRLQGPGKWSGARDAIVTVHRRVMRPLNSTPVIKNNLNDGKYFLPLILSACFIAIAMFFLS